MYQVTYPLVSEVVWVNVFQGNTHQMRWDVSKDARQLFSCLQVRPGPGKLHISQVLTHTQITIIFPEISYMACGCCPTCLYFMEGWMDVRTSW